MTFFNRLSSLLNTEHPTMRKAMNITRRKVSPLKSGPTRLSKHTTRRLNPGVRQRLTGRSFVPAGQASRNVYMAKVVASNQANRLDPIRKTAKNKPSIHKLTSLFRSTLGSKKSKRSAVKA